MFLEMLSFYECYVPLAEKLNIPIIGTTSLRSWIYADRAVGNPGGPTYVPTILADIGSIESFHTRFVGFIHELFVEVLRLSYEIPNIRAIYKRYYSSYNLNYTKKVSLVFTNNHPIILSRPTVPNNVEVGGLKVKSSQLEPLPRVRIAFFQN